MGSRQQAGCRDATGSINQAHRRGAAGSGAEAPGDKGKRHRSYVPQPSSSSSPSPPRQWPVAGSAKEGGRGGQSSGTESGMETRPPKDPTGGQRHPEEPRSAPAPRLSVPALEPSAPANQEPRAPPYPEPRAAAAPEQPTPFEPAPSIPRAEVVAARVAPEVIERLEAAIAAERSKVDRDRAALVEERGRLEEVGRLLEARIASARATPERSMRTVAEEQEALEEARDEVVAAQDKASRMERQATERDHASWRRAWKLLARE
ncbi:predicted GPI-anchored protein 58 [Phragmites australis]|uniref:predicted GPI-anchored protein 58 n=1 Tax=Phragmites australis TaxID=29695 RepID=UPI002D781C9B|nr:predicted GPI-anchored protein 58 [Phragmites australis]